MYIFQRTIPINEPGQVVLDRQDVWEGLVKKANNALPYVAMMQKCEVIERGENWLVRDILLAGLPMRERVTFEPQTRVVFQRTEGADLGRIENIIGQDTGGNLTLTFTFALTHEGAPEDSAAESQYFAPLEGAYLAAVASTLAEVRRTLVADAPTTDA